MVAADTGPRTLQATTMQEICPQSLETGRMPKDAGTSAMNMQVVQTHNTYAVISFKESITLSPVHCFDRNFLHWQAFSRKQNAKLAKDWKKTKQNPCTNGNLLEEEVCCKGYRKDAPANCRSSPTQPSRRRCYLVPNKKIAHLDWLSLCCIQSQQEHTSTECQFLQHACIIVNPALKGTINPCLE